MPDTIVVLSGPIGAGKSELAKRLTAHHRFTTFKTRELLLSALGSKAAGRAHLQLEGARLDKKTRGRWVVDALVRLLGSLPDDARVVVDSVRIKAQVDHLREAFRRRVWHVHLFASESVLAKRYAARREVGASKAAYAAAKKDPTEAAVGSLQDHADAVVNTERSTPEDVAVRVASALGLYSRAQERLVDVVVGAQFGSEGKGNVVDHIAPEYDIIVRNGGANAGHTVYSRPDHHRYHHLPSGTRSCPGVKVLSPGAVLHVGDLLEEIVQCGAYASPGRLVIDPQAMIVEEDDRRRERRKLRATIASTASGVGIATARKLLREEAKPPVRLAKDVKELWPYLRDTKELLEDAYASGKRILVEGTQGTGLSVHHGYYPYVTSRETTASGCVSEAGIPPSRVRRVLMVVRTYPIRVQNPPGRGKTSGPMQSPELSWTEIARRSGVPIAEIRKTERTTTTKRRRRVSEFGWSEVRRAALLNGPTDVAVTFTDYLSVENRAARRFDQLTPDTILFIEELERVTGARASLIVTRFHYRGIIDRRQWDRVRSNDVIQPR